MKKSHLNLAAKVLICGAFMFTSCVGSFFITVSRIACLSDLSVLSGAIH